MRIILLALLLSSCGYSWHVDASRPIRDYEYRIVVYGDSVNKYDIYDAYGQIVASQIESKQIDSIMIADNL